MSAEDLHSTLHRAESACMSISSSLFRRSDSLRAFSSRSGEKGSGPPSLSPLKSSSSSSRERAEKLRDGDGPPLPTMLRAARMVTWLARRGELACELDREFGDVGCCWLPPQEGEFHNNPSTSTPKISFELPPFRDPLCLSMPSKIVNQLATLDSMFRAHYFASFNTNCCAFFFFTTKCRKLKWKCCRSQER